MTMYGYARVSSKDQNLNRQLDALFAIGVSEESVFVDYLSGRNFDRPGYQSLLERLQPGDVLVEKSIDRQRQAEGIAAARARGVKLGRPALAVPEEFDAVHRKWEDGCLNSRQAAESLGVSHTTFLKWVKQRPADVTISHKSMRS